MFGTKNLTYRMPKLIRITTVPIALKYLLAGQMRFMKEHGFEVIMVSADGEGREDVIIQEGCEHRIIPMTRKITPFADIKSLWKLYKLFKKERPDIVHSHTPKAGLLSMIAAKFAGVKIRVHTIAGLRFMTSTGATRKLLIQMEKLTARFATHVWPNSFSLLKYIKDNKLVPSNKLEVIGGGSSNGIRLSRFSSAALNTDHLKEVKELVRYDEKNTYLLCVGRIVKDKGIEELTRSFLKLYEQNKQLRLILVGSFEDELDPLSADIKKLIKDHPAIILTGWREDVEYFMPLAFALVHPSYREGFPNVLLQAGAMNCPVICSRIEGNVDVVEDKITGLLFEAQDEDSLFEQLKNALSNPEMLKSYSQNLLQKIQQQFDQSVLHQKILDKYNSLLSY
jgi:glycosyltransferase involved in cell wall biosynthesis